MNKKTKRFIGIGFVALIYVVVILLFSTRIRPNNTTPYTQMITQTYSPQQISKLQKEICERTITYFEFALRYKVECCRQTAYGYYAILQQHDGCKVFVFFSKSKRATHLLKYDSFTSIDELDIKIGKTTEKDLMLYDDNLFYSDTSCYSFFIILQEGLLVVRCDFSDEHVVEFTNFVPNDQLKDNKFYASDRYQHFYILDIDKVE